MVVDGVNDFASFMFFVTQNVLNPCFSGRFCRGYPWLGAFISQLFLLRALRCRIGLKCVWNYTNIYILDLHATNKTTPTPLLVVCPYYPALLVYNTQQCDLELAEWYIEP